MNNFKLYGYIVYLIIGLAVTFFVGRDLHRKGYYLILDLFEHEGFTQTINNILLVLYYLFNMGYISITLINIGEINSLIELIEKLSVRIGLVLFLLGSLHINNILTLQLLSKRKHKIIQFFNH